MIRSDASTEGGKFSSPYSTDYYACVKLLFGQCKNWATIILGKRLVAQVANERLFRFGVIYIDPYPNNWAMLLEVFAVRSTTLRPMTIQNDRLRRQISKINGLNRACCDQLLLN